MATLLSKLRAQINESLRLIDKEEGLGVNEGESSFSAENQPVLAPLFQKNDSLLDNCDAVCEMYENQKPILRIVHHFACSGGTLISKCLAALPNVFLLSELHPHSRLHMNQEQPAYMPSDLVTLSRYAGIPHIIDLEKTLFRQSLDQIFKHVEKHGGVLVLRDHTHADYCMDGPPSESSSIIALLESDYRILDLVTVRHPLDSYLSMLDNGWVYFRPATLDEYCRRLHIFVQSHVGSTIFKYEDFVTHPDSGLRELCKSLELQYSVTALDTFDIFSVTGNSGRKGNVIGPRSRRKIPKDLFEEIDTSMNYRSVCLSLGYEFERAGPD